MSASLGSAAWPDVRGGLLAIPVGATEQHGPHLPLSTDTDIAVALAERLPGALVAPPVAFGSSGEHRDFPGSLSIGRDALTLVLVELVRSASAAFSRIVLISAHGGNAQPVARAVEQLQTEGRDVTAWSPRWSGDAHAGRTETSIMLALHPELVRLGLAEAGNRASLDSLMPALRARGVRSVSSNGVLGDPAGASAREGHVLLESAAGDLIETVGVSEKAV
jgi:mycofactocin system creatininase family protein